MRCLCEHAGMQPLATTIELARARCAAITLSGLLLMAAADPAIAAGCAFAPQGEGRVTEIVDARSFRLADGRDVILAGIEPVTSSDGKTTQSAALSAIIAGHDVTLGGNDDMPDRYGRQPAFVFLDSSGTSVQVSVQAQLLAQGAALVAATVTDKECATALAAAEATARDAKRGIWADPTVIKNTESPGDILAGIGRFTGRGQGFVGSASWGNHLSEFWPELDTGLCCDYSKAHDPRVRGCWNHA
jgi:endonuclease YncB( thermonuclease family)